MRTFLSLLFIAILLQSSVSHACFLCCCLNTTSSDEEASSSDDEDALSQIRLLHDQKEHQRLLSKKPSLCINEEFSYQNSNISTDPIHWSFFEGTWNILSKSAVVKRGGKVLTRTESTTGEFIEFRKNKDNSYQFRVKTEWFNIKAPVEIQSDGTIMIQSKNKTMGWINLFYNVKDDNQIQFDMKPFYRILDKKSSSSLLKQEALTERAKPFEDNL